MDIDCPAVELRQYTIRGGRRGEFKRLFGERFVTSQEAQGIRVLGWFDDRDDADRFVWVRGFASMEERARGLAAFYGSDVWKARRDRANAMIVDSDNVLLLRPLAGEPGVNPADMRASPFVTAAIHYLHTSDAAPFGAFFRERLLGKIRDWGAQSLGHLCTDPEPNNFPRLPVRSGESVFVWFAGFRSEEQQVAFSRQWSAESGWRDDLAEPLLAALMRKPEVLRLEA